MSVRAIHAVDNSALVETPAERNVLNALADQADDDGFVVYRDRRVEVLAAKTRYHEATFRRICKGLAKRGLLEMVLRQGRGQVNDFRIRVDVLEAGPLMPFAAAGRGRRKPDSLSGLNRAGCPDDGMGCLVSDDLNRAGCPGEVDEMPGLRGAYKEKNSKQPTIKGGKTRGGAREARPDSDLLRNFNHPPDWCDLSTWSAACELADAVEHSDHPGKLRGEGGMLRAGAFARLAEYLESHGHEGEGMEFVQRTVELLVAHWRDDNRLVQILGDLRCWPDGAYPETGQLVDVGGRRRVAPSRVEEASRILVRLAVLGV